MGAIVSPINSQPLLGGFLEFGNVELKVVAGQNGIEHDAHQRSHGKARKRNRHAAQLQHDGTGGAIGNAERKHEHQSCHQHVAVVLEIDLVFDKVAYAHGTDHAIEHERHAADYTRRHGRNDGRELGAERKHDGAAGGNAGANNDDVIDGDFKEV